MAGLRTILFGSASRFSLASFLELASRQQLAALVLPGPSATGVRRLMRGLAGRSVRPEVEQAARERGIPVLHWSPAAHDALAARLRQLAPDLMCISIFPRLLPPELIAIAPLGAINVHPSLLPRHRGPLPMFWTYHSGDAAAGVTVHHADARFDAGDVILREGVSLRRAYPAVDLDRDLAIMAARLLCAAVSQLAACTAVREPQDEKSATHAPLLRQGARMVPFEAWEVSQVHHFLAGLWPRYREPLVDPQGRALVYHGIAGFEHVEHGVAPGQVEPRGAGWRLFCRGGVVDLA